jgi:hypothetical protein
VWHRAYSSVGDELGVRECFDVGLRWLDQRIDERRAGCAPFCDGSAEAELRRIFSRLADCGLWIEVTKPTRRPPAGPIRRV